MRRLAAGAAAGFVWPAANAAHPVYARSLRDASPVPSGLPMEAPVSGSPQWLFLNVAQAAAFVPLAEAILPGSTAAQVGPFVDLLLSVESKEHQRAFLASLKAMDAEASREFGAGFARLGDAQRTALLARVSESAPAAAGAQPGLREHFQNLKEWVVGAYYSSEIGMRELGWTGNRVFDKFPECEHSSQDRAGF